MMALLEPRRALAVAIIALVILCFLPMRWIRWESSFGRLAQIMVVPVSGPLSLVSRWASPATKKNAPPEQIAALEQELAALKAQVLVERAENGELRKALAEIRVLVEVSPDASVKQVYAPVVGAAGDLATGLLTVRAGSRHGITTSSVATGRGMQLIGRVTSVGSRTSTVLPITGADEKILGVVMVSDSVALPCSLRPTGEGTFRGPVEDRRDPQSAAPIEPKLGDEVRLSDTDRWPRCAQMLMIGKVEKIQPAPEQPLRKIITVRPIVERIDRVGQVIIRTGAGSLEGSGS